MTALQPTEAEFEIYIRNHCDQIFESMGEMKTDQWFYDQSVYLRWFDSGWSSTLLDKHKGFVDTWYGENH